MARHQTTIDPGLDPALLPAVRAADDDIARVLGEAAPRVGATWKPGPRQPDSSPLAVLELTDSGVSRDGSFAGSDFSDPVHLRHRVWGVWDSVLAERLRLQRLRVLESLATEA